MALGLCCQWIEEKKLKKGSIKIFNAFEEKKLQYGLFKSGKYKEENILKIWKNNLTNVRNMIPKILSSGIRVFRLSSNILPLFEEVSHLGDDYEISSLLKEIGKLILSNNVRLTCHPSQFCVLSSKEERIIQNSIKMLNTHAWIFDTMGLPISPYYCINIHGGAKGRSATLINSINLLKDSVRGRLTLENDELSYSVKDLYSVLQSFIYFIDIYSQILTSIKNN